MILMVRSDVECIEKRSCFSSQFNSARRALSWLAKAECETRRCSYSISDPIKFPTRIDSDSFFRSAKYRSTMHHGE